uniref:hypothetical protein n=1 Tax=Xenorhabdus budapestensis TaxID=290110 RepID=UPI00147645FE
MEQVYYCGIDIAKSQFDCAIRLNNGKYKDKVTRCSTLTSYNVGLLKPVALTFTLFKIGKNTQRV